MRFQIENAVFKFTEFFGVVYTRPRANFVYFYLEVKAFVAYSARVSFHQTDTLNRS